MFVPCVARRSINNQHYALNYITSLFNMQAPTCFGSSFPSSGSFLDPCELLEQIGGISYNVYVACVPGCCCVSQLTARTQLGNTRNRNSTNISVYN
jgi:hypothetical protein